MRLTVRSHDLIVIEVIPVTWVIPVAVMMPVTMVMSHTVMMGCIVRGVGKIIAWINGIFVVVFRLMVIIAWAKCNIGRGIRYRC